MMAPSETKPRALLVATVMFDPLGDGPSLSRLAAWRPAAVSCTVAHRFRGFEGTGQSGRLLRRGCTYRGNTMVRGSPRAGVDTYLPTYLLEPVLSVLSLVFIGS